jgi:hypothetical protein
MDWLKLVRKMWAPDIGPNNIGATYLGSHHVGSHHVGSHRMNWTNISSHHTIVVIIPPPVGNHLIVGFGISGMAGVAGLPEPFGCAGVAA